ncbi:phenoloxidase-activating factor 2-like [Leptidea sinapis]|uniref:phenoloxidase-activating factor 2-like n=1 Tax=Leptidea sinapis TaxID=189913 RepID=UPI0021C3DE27|nr:phenoloxidase-activating factor 2-like [Leptidea sinapis]
MQDVPDTSTEGNKCMTSDSKPGVCVMYYQCNDNNSVNTDGAGIIDIRYGDSCPSMYETCCQVDEQDKSSIQRPEKKISGCGWRHPNGVGPNRTVNRGEANFGELPWMIALLKLIPINPQDSNSGLMNMYAGGGSLIHPKVVLTAAHVVTSDDSHYVARAGEWDSQNLDENYPYQDRNVAQIVRHEDFNNKNLRNDIALLFLASQMKLAPNVGLACLPPVNFVLNYDSKCITSGWGLDQYGKQGRYQNVLKKTGQNRYVEVGIVSWGIGCGGDGVPAAYVNVAMFRDWIDEALRKRGVDNTPYTY